MTDELSDIPFDNGPPAVIEFPKGESVKVNGRDKTPWPEPKPLPEGLLPVARFDNAFLPDALRPWAADISDRMQCPPDFVGVSAIVALGAVLGRKVAIRPQLKTDWFEVPNLWGMLIGRPGVMKSPAMSEALKPLRRLEADARLANEAAAKDYEKERTVLKIRKEEAERKVREAIKKGEENAERHLSFEEPAEPKPRRYIVDDTSYEKLGEILSDNPNGVLAFRDEIVSLLKTLDRDEQAAARGFYLSAWNGKTGYTFDRIIRGKTRVECACVSLLGSTQPGKLAEYMLRANAGNDGDDGLIQRFGLLVWPDQSPEWRDVDDYPDSAARKAAWETFERLDNLNPLAIGAEKDQFEPVPFLRFDAPALDVFKEWRAELEKKLRAGGGMSEALESHIAKYRKLAPALALINHLADGGQDKIGESAIVRALALCEYLESHARRAYAAGSQAETTTAKAILSRIRKGDLTDRFSARDIYRSQWTNLANREQVQAGLDLLCDLDWIAPNEIKTAGRPRITFAINPRAAK
ncbi:MAG: YfjI family protein [Methylocystis sp.]|uniref:YfjI family protein n=1 Tax=Methylocystis sp. TaxID=1911079 RepID=UPI00394A940B